MKISYYNILRSLINNYEQFRIIASNLNWVHIDTEFIDGSQHQNEVFWGIHKIHFPKGYVAEYTKEAIVQSLLKVIADYEEWEDDFWEKISREERLYCLDNGKQLYSGYICYEKLKLNKLSFKNFLDDIHSWGLCDERAEQSICQFPDAEVIALGSNGYGPDENWIAIQDDTIVFVEFYCSS